MTLNGFTGSELGALSYPGIHRVSDRFIHHITQLARPSLSPALAQVIFESEIAQRTMVIVTTERAVLSPFLVAEMRRFGNFWAYQAHDLSFRNALSGLPVRGWGDLVSPARPDEMPWFPPAESGQAHAAISIEVVAHHRAEGSLLVGALAEAFATTGGRANLDVMGMREPLTAMWSRAALTQRVRSQMPKAEMVRAASPDGAFVDLAYERSPQGVIERMNGRLVLGEYGLWASQAVNIAAGILTHLADLCVPVIMTTSLIDVEPCGGQGIRRRHEEVPLAWLGGPMTVRRAEAEVDVLAERYAGRRIGRRAVPSLLVTFPSQAGDPRQQLQRLLTDIELGGRKAAAANEEARPNGDQ